LQLRRDGARRDRARLPDTARRARARLPRRPKLSDATPPAADGLPHHRGDRARAAWAGPRDDVPRAAAHVGALRRVDLARGPLRATAGEDAPKLGYPGALMARAAVKAKQQAKAKAQPAKPTRVRGRRRRGSGGGNPNQQLFFMRLRRGQKWLYAVLA